MATNQRSIKSGVVVSLSGPNSSDDISGSLKFLLSDGDGECCIQGNGKNAECLKAIILTGFTSQSYVTILVNEDSVVEHATLHATHRKVFVALYVRVDQLNDKREIYSRVFLGGEFVQQVENFSSRELDIESRGSAGLLIRFGRIPDGLELFSGNCSIENASNDSNVKYAIAWSACREYVIFGLKKEIGGKFVPLLDLDPGTAFFCTMLF